MPWKPRDPNADGPTSVPYPSPMWDEIGEYVRYYSRLGHPITMRQWVWLYNDAKYVIVESDEVGPYWLSTVWLGLDHSFSSGDPMIFETMLFEAERKTMQAPWGPMQYNEELDCRRYATLEDARDGHKLMLELVRVRAGVNSSSSPPP